MERRDLEIVQESATELTTALRVLEFGCSAARGMTMSFAEDGSTVRTGHGPRDVQ